MQKEFNQKGQISRFLLIGAGVVLIIIIVVFAVIFFTRDSNSEGQQNGEQQVIPEPPKPVYEKQIGDIYFILESSTDLGNVLKSQSSYNRQDLITTEKFIRVVVAAQNKGKIATKGNGWELGNIIDSEQRIFPAINAFNFLPNPNPCGISLKPEFYPVSCTKIYEVAKVSKDLKVEIISKDKNGGKDLLDLNFNQ